MAIPLPTARRTRHHARPEATDTKVSALLTVSVLPSFRTPDWTIVVRNAGPGAVDQVRVTLAGTDEESAADVVGLTLPTDSLQPGEACVVRVSAQEPQRFVRAEWRCGDDSGAVLAVVR